MANLVSNSEPITNADRFSEPALLQSSGASVLMKPVSPAAQRDLSAIHSKQLEKMLDCLNRVDEENIQHANLLKELKARFLASR